MPDRRTLASARTAPETAPSALLETILARAPVGLGFLDSGLRFVRLNDALASGNRVPRRAHLGRTIAEIWPDIPADLLARLRRVATGDDAVIDYAVEVPGPSGEPARQVLGSYYPVRNANGEVLGVGVVVVDVTRQTATERALRASEERARRSEARKAAMLDAALDAIISIDAGDRIVEVNPAAERIFGFRAADVLGRELAEVIVPPHLREEHRGGVRHYRPGSPGRLLGHRVELEAMRVDGSEFPAEVAITEIDAAGEAMFTGFVRDLTAAKHAEAALRDLALSQAALRRVATLVAAGASPAAVFARVTEEAGRLLAGDTCNLIRFEGGTLATVASAWREPGIEVLPVGSTIDLHADTSVARVRYTGRPARMDSYEGVPGELAARLRAMGLQATVASPIRLGDRLWGAIATSTVGRHGFRFPAGAEAHLADFADLVAQALANADTREQLRASRARLVEAAGAERRRLERNLHDGAQQRLVSLSLGLRLADAKLETDAEAARELMRAARAELALALEELRELARGIHPMILTERGLASALESLAGRSPLPVDVSAPDERLPEAVEAAVYYVVAECLANAAKHSSASHVAVSVERAGACVKVDVADDGVGGAQEAAGSGLRGLADRVEALGGALSVDSPRGRGTRVHGEIPWRQ